ncbi:hypothetical protein VXM60_14030 [Shewanella khirikhana]|uniref:hypothetical protein n=1 Tax=Shewanella khirikhana TaxID=1965282 RepID=UPI0030D05C01
MPDRQLMRTQPITGQDRQQLQAYGFSDNEIDLLRCWVMESTWEKGERSDALKELSAIAVTLEKMQNKLIRLGHRNTAMVRDILHIHQQLDANGTPPGFLATNFSYLDYLDSAQKLLPPASDVMQTLCADLQKLQSAIGLYTNNMQSSLLLRQGPTLLEKKLSTGKELLMQGLHHAWIQKYPADKEVCSDAFFNFMAILFQSCDANNAEVPDPEVCRRWWSFCTKQNLETGENLHYPIHRWVNDDGTESYTPPKDSLSD